MNSIIFIETNKSGSSREGIRAAKKNGYKVHLLTNRRSFLEQRDEFPDVDEMYFCHLKNKEHIIAQIDEIQKKHSVEIIISFIENYVTLAAELHNRFCHNIISEHAYNVMKDKLQTRIQLHGNPYTPYYFIYKKNDPLKTLLSEIKQLYPLILKSPSSSGSKDVYLINNEYQMINRIQYLQRKNPNEDLLIEEYLEGPQFNVECMVHKGEIFIAAIIEQEITKQNKFIVTGYSISSDVEESVTESITDITKSILTDLQMENGNCHLELRLVKGEWKLIEINPRISGGVMNRLIEEAYGFNYAEEILRVYRGLQPSLIKKYEKCIFVQYSLVDYIGTLIEVTGVKSAKKMPGIIEVFIKSSKGQILSPPLSMGHRYGYVIAHGSSKDEAKTRAIQASEQIKFHLLQR
ncbi:MAG TPA: ATP-grasp domain-containing protein [Bacillales bacterium]|nr:ATP-grasp domain-containing protein [Bacillales bacterium]